MNLGLELQHVVVEKSRGIFHCVGLSVRHPESILEKDVAADDEIARRDVEANIVTATCLDARPAGGSRGLPPLLWSQWRHGRPAESGSTNSIAA